MSSSTALRAYCESLSLHVPELITDDLQRDAILWSALQEERLDDVIALLDGYMGRPMARQVSLWLYQKLGAAECIRRALDDDRFFEILFYSARQQGPRAFIQCIRQVPPNEEAGKEIFFIISDYELPPGEIIALTAEVRRLASRSQRMDEYGIEHELSHELPRYISQLSVRQIFELCDHVQPLWDWVVSKRPVCEVCIEVGCSKILEESAKAYMKDPAQKEVLSCLADKRRSRLSRRVALRLVALFPMHKREQRLFDALSWFERGIADEVSIRNTLRDLSRDPRFSKYADILAAMLRQGATPQEIDALPPLDTQPTTELDNLVMQLSWLGAWIQRKYPMPEAILWSPRLWDLYFHRRLVTPWRRALWSSVKELSDWGRNAHLQLLSSIGDAAGVARIIQPNDRASTKFSQKIDRIRWQLKHTTFEDFDADWRDVQGDEIDAALVRAALQYLSSLRQPTQEHEERTKRALTIVLTAQIPKWIKLGVVERFAQIEPRQALIAALRKSEVNEQSLCDEMPLPLLLRLWSEPSLRSFIVQDLSKMFRNSDVARYLRRLLLAAAEMKISLPSSFLSACVASLYSSGDLCEVISCYHKDLLQALARALLEEGEIELWVGAYRMLSDAHSASWFFQVLAQYPSIPTERFEAIKQDEEPSRSDIAMFDEWLQVQLQRRRALEISGQPHPEPSEHDTSL